MLFFLSCGVARPLIALLLTGVPAGTQTPPTPGRTYNGPAATTTYEPQSAAAGAPGAPPRSLRLMAPLPTGQDLVPPQGGPGMGTLWIDNPSADCDAVVKLVDGANPDRVLRCVYLRAQEAAVISTLGSGTYRLLFSTGIDRDRAASRFMREAQYHELRAPLTFEERRIGNGVQYVHYSIALPEGAATTTTSVAETIFRAGIYGKMKQP